VALCAQPFGWLTLVEVSKTLLLCGEDVQKPGEGGEGRQGCLPPPFSVQWCNAKGRARGPALRRSKVQG